MRYLGQIDINRLNTLGREGCYTSRGFVNDTRSTAGFSPKSQTEIRQNSEKINSLYLGLGQKASDIQKLGNLAQINYQKYINTEVPVCGTGITGTLSKFVGTSGYQECLKKVDEARNPLMAANTQFTNMSNKMRDLNADYSELMIYAPNVLDWQKLCQAKLSLDARHQELRHTNLQLVDTALKKLKNELTTQEKADDEFSKWERILQMFLDALRALVEMVKSVFESFLKGLTKLSAFIADHPWVFWTGGGVLVLSILAVILRPYISLFNFISS